MLHNITGFSELGPHENRMTPSGLSGSEDRKRERTRGKGEKKIKSSHSVPPQFPMDQNVTQTTKTVK